MGFAVRSQAISVQCLPGLANTCYRINRQIIAASLLLYCLGNMWSLTSALAMSFNGCLHVYINIHTYIHIYIYIHRHVFRPSQDSSVWLGLTSREQLMSPECSKHQVLSFAKMLVVWWTNRKYSVFINVLQSARWINSERRYIYIYSSISIYYNLGN